MSERKSKLQKCTNENTLNNFKGKTVYEVIIDDILAFLIVIISTTDATINMDCYIINGTEENGDPCFTEDNMVELFIKAYIKFDGSIHMWYGEDSDGYILTDIVYIKNNYIILEALCKLSIELNIIHDNMYTTGYSYDMLEVVK